MSNSMFPNKCFPYVTLKENCVYRYTCVYICVHIHMFTCIFGNKCLEQFLHHQTITTNQSICNAGIKKIYGIAKLVSSFLLKGTEQHSSIFGILCVQQWASIIPMVIPKAGAYVNIVHIIAIKYDNDKLQRPGWFPIATLRWKSCIFWIASTINFTICSSVSAEIIFFS